MDFLSTPMPTASGTEEKVEKRYVAWNTGIEYLSKEARARVTAANIGKKRSAESRAKQSLSSRGRRLNTEQKKAISEKAKQRWQDPIWVAAKSHKGKSMSLEEKEMRSESAKRRWANTPEQQRKKAKINVKLFLTPYGKITLQEALEKSGLKVQQIRGRIARQTQGWGPTNEYIIVEKNKGWSRL